MNEKITCGERTYLSQVRLFHYLIMFHRIKYYFFLLLIMSQKQQKIKDHVESFEVSVSMILLILFGPRGVSPLPLRNLDGASTGKSTMTDTSVCLFQIGVPRAEVSFSLG